MKECFVVTSSIQTSNVPLTYSGSRTSFTSEERFRQTIYTVSSIISQKPEASIYIFDSSYEYSDYSKILNQFPNVTFIPVKEISQEVQEVVNSHSHKSYCECLLLNTFFDYFVDNFDFYYKASGRYVFDLKNNTVSPEKIYFKYPTHFVWQESWNDYFALIDHRKEEGHNFYKQYCTVLYGFGSKHIPLMKKNWKDIQDIVTRERHIQYDVEGLLYHLTRPCKSLVEHTDWVVTGFEGATGRLLRY